MLALITVKNGHELYNILSSPPKLNLMDTIQNFVTGVKRYLEKLLEDPLHILCTQMKRDYNFPTD